MKASNGKPRQSAKAIRSRTESSKHHTFQSFSAKVANIKIDPVRRIQRHQEDSDKVETFFRPAFDQWMDANLSTNFVEFSHEVNTITESLPQILFHQDEIMNSFIKYIELNDSLSMEPLLSLLAQFARDLGPLFEKHFARTVTTVCQLIAKSTEIEVIEWSFNFLAYLLKYLSRLLVADLRPVFELFSPLLGAQSQKQYVIQYAAEAFSFLLRKAKSQPLRLVLDKAFDILAELPEGERAQYSEGLQAMLLESCMGVGYNIHSKATQIITTVLQVAEASSRPDLCAEVYEGFLTGLIHRTTQETFEPVQDAIFEHLNVVLTSDRTGGELWYFARLLFVIISVRRGGRISKWGVVGDIAQEILNKLSTLDVSEETHRQASWEVAKCVAVFLDKSDFEYTITKFPRLAERLTKLDGGAYFLPFCEFAAELSEDKFKNIILPYLQKFLIGNWEASETYLSILLPTLSEASEKDLKLSNLSSWTEHLSKSFNPQAQETEALVKNWKSLDIAKLIMSREDYQLFISDVAQPFTLGLLTRFKTSPEQKQLIPIIGKGLNVLSEGKEPFKSVLNSVLEVLPACADNTAFLSGFCNFITGKEHSSFTKSVAENADVVNKLIESLCSADQPLRRTTLRALDILYSAKTRRSNATIELMQEIGNTDITITNHRNVSMHIRKLGSTYAEDHEDDWLAKMVPRFLFGLLTVNFAPIWADSVAALAKVVEINEGLVAEIALRWLTLEEAQSHKRAEEDDGRMRLTPYQCTNNMDLNRTAEKCLNRALQPLVIIEGTFEGAQRTIPLSHQFGRTQALLVLCEVPQIAEKRSKQVVPLLLEATKFHLGEENDEDDDDDEEELDAGSKWNWKDREGLLTLFSKFGNPKALYKSEEVFNTYLELVGSKDGKVQVLALKCLITFKISAINSYKDELNGLIEDSRFRETLTSFIQVSRDESLVRLEHREQLMPVLLRILYGRSVSRQNAKSTKRGMASRRQQILSCLANFSTKEQGQFIDIMLGNLTRMELIDKSDPSKFMVDPMAVSTALFSSKRLLGLTRMIKEMFEQLGADLISLIPKLLDSVLFALRLVNTDTGLVKKDKGESTITEKALRLGCVEVLVSMFRYCPSFSWAPYMPIVYEEAISARLENLPADASQTPTAVLKLFDAWTLDEHTIQFLAYNAAIMQRTIDVIGAKSIKDEVLIFIFNMLIRIMDLAESRADLRDSIKKSIVVPNMENMLTQIGDIVRKSPGKDAFEKAILTISKIASFVQETNSVDQMLDLCSFLLDQPLRRVNPKTKKEVLRIIYNFLPGSKLSVGDELYERLFKQTCVQFAFFNDRESRVLLSQLFEVFSQREEALREVALLLTDLNSFSQKHLDEPDFQRRLAAFAKINDEIYAQLTPRQWAPIVQNMLFYVKEQEELAIRRSASYSIKRFVECCASHWNSDNKDAFMGIISESVYPAILQGSREKSELIRIEYINALSNIVQLLPEWENTKDLVPLLVDGDEEASFFNNILNIQQHRRLKALRRLAALASKHNLRSTNVSQFLLPLIEHFVFDPAEDAHNISAEAVHTMGALGSQLTWQQFRAVFKRYISYIKSKEDLIKVVIRLIGAFADCMTEAVAVKEAAYAAKEAKKKEEEAAEGVEKMDTAEDGAEAEESTELDATVDADGDIVSSAPVVITPLASTLPRGKKLGNELTTTVLPVITRYLHDKDEATVSLRVPVAVTAVKLLKLLPEDDIGRKLPGVLMDVAHILRSRSQDSRDLTRKTLADITRILGPRYFSYVIDQLRNALQRGYQLHVLSYTMHSILVSVTPDYGPGELDYCIGQIVAIIMDDIFGVTGQEKDEEDYVSKMKEVKSSKSYDSMELLSKMATTGYLSKLIRPIQDLVQESLSLKTVKKIDELLRRINNGLLTNPEVQSRDLLVFCYELFQEGYKVKELKKVDENETGKKRHEGKARYLVNLTVPRQSVTAAVGNTHPYKLVRFALDILRVTFSRNDDLMTPENVANFVPLIGDAMLSPHEEVGISALRLLNTIIKVPLASIDEGMPVFTQRAMQFIKNSPSTNAEIAQASLKLLTSALRERKNSKIKESMVAYLLTRLKSDLEEPDRQGISFNFLKAVIARRVVIPEVYDVADHVATIMITNQTRAVRDLARSVFFQFLMDFPQGKDRLNKQLAFLIKNLDYVHASGRQSVLELIHHLLTKVGDNLIQQIVGTFFVPLVMVLVNDDSVECREMTGSLMKELFERADKEKMTTSLGLMKTWLNQNDKAVLTRVALQLYGIYIDVFGERSRQETEKVLSRITEILSFDPEEEEETPWEQIYFSLQICTKITKIFPELIFSTDSTALWKSVISRLSYPHAWVKLTASRLVGMMFGQLANEDLSKLPLTTPHGLSLEADEMSSIARMSASQLNNPEVSDELGLQSVKNLLFLGRVFHAAGLDTKDPQSITIAEEEEEEEGQDEEDEEEEKKDSKKSALLWLMGRISSVIRNERTVKKGTKGKKFALQWLAAICQVLPVEAIEPLAEKIILPLYNLIDNPANEALIGDLKTTAQEILQICQQKMSNTVYSNAYSAVRQQVLERRRLRKHKRSIQLVANPETAANKKIKKHERKKVARKEKSKEWRDKRRAKNF